jgi:hypothetical protein
MAATGHRRGRLPSAARQETAAVLLLLEDMRIAMLLVNAARYRALNRWLGLDKTGANLVTLVAAAAAVEAAQRQTARVVAPGAPGAADFALGAAAAESALLSLAGRAAAGAAPGSLLLTIAVAYKLIGVPTRRAMREVTRAPFRLRKAMLEQAQRLAEAASGAADAATVAARMAVGGASPTDEASTTSAAEATTTPTVS